jgi:pyridoxine 4-dehydrogenase
MIDISKAGTFALGGRVVKRLGYGAMQLAGPGVFGPPKDRNSAIAVLREAVASGVNHIDTSDFYGPHVTNQLIREALHPYPTDLVIVTKIGARRGNDASWSPAFSREELIAAVHDNLRNLGVDALDVVNLRSMFSIHGPAEGSLEAPLTVLAELQRQGLVRHIGLSNVTATQIAEGPTPARPMRRSSRLAASRRCNRPLCRMSPAGSAPRRCRWRSPGCCSARPTSC